MRRSDKLCRRFEFDAPLSKRLHLWGLFDKLIPICSAFRRVHCQFDWISVGRSTFYKWMVALPGGCTIARLSSMTCHAIQPTLQVTWLILLHAKCVVAPFLKCAARLPVHYTHTPYQYTHFQLDNAKFLTLKMILSRLKWKWSGNYMM